MPQQDAKLIGTLHIVLASFGLLAALIVLFVLASTGLAIGDPMALAIMGQVGGGIALFLTLLSLPGFVGGIALLRGASWAPVLLTVVSVLNLLNLPLGTAVGIFTLVRFWQTTPENGTVQPQA